MKRYSLILGMFFALSSSLLEAHEDGIEELVGKGGPSSVVNDLRAEEAEELLRKKKHDSRMGPVRSQSTGSQGLKPSGPQRARSGTLDAGSKGFGSGGDEGAHDGIDFIRKGPAGDDQGLDLSPNDFEQSATLLETFGQAHELLGKNSGDQVRVMTEEEAAANLGLSVSAFDQKFEDREVSLERLDPELYPSKSFNRSDTLRGLDQLQASTEDSEQVINPLQSALEGKSSRIIQQKSRNIRKSLRSIRDLFTKEKLRLSFMKVGKEIFWVGRGIGKVFMAVAKPVIAGALIVAKVVGATAAIAVAVALVFFPPVTLLLIYDRIYVPYALAQGNRQSGSRAFRY